jgi:hypothetical protein
VARYRDLWEARLDRFAADLTRTVAPTQYTTSDGIGDAFASLSPAGYSGWAWVVADEYGSGPSGFIPFPYSLWYHVYVC